MEKSYRETKDFLINKLIEDVSTQSTIKFKIDKSSLNEREELFNAVLLTCQALYKNKRLPDNLKTLLKKFGVKKSQSGWLCIDFGNFKGKFINANAIFKYVYCESKQCHKSAYHFIIDYKREDMKLKSGIIQYYDEVKGNLHSICTFKNEGEEYVFDGANFLLMNKMLYDKLFLFEEIQSLSREEVLKDKIDLEYKNLHHKGIIKSKSRYQPIKNQSNRLKRFSGLGFVIYLYNRNAIMNNNASVDDLEKDNNKALKLLNEKLIEIYGEDTFKYWDNF